MIIRLLNGIQSCPNLPKLPFQPATWTNWAIDAVKVVIIDDDSSSKMSSVQGYLD